MKTLATVVVTLLSASTFFSAGTANAAQKRTPEQAACASMDTGKGEGKFTGQIYSAAPGSFQVTSGKEKAAVNYNNSLLICEGGQFATTGALLPGATIEVLGPMQKKGNNLQFEATKVFISSAAPASASRPEQTQPVYAQAMPVGGSARGIAPPAGGNLIANEATQGNVIGSSARGGAVTSSNTSTIACNSLQFEIMGASSPTGNGVRKTTATPITCRRNVDQESMLFLQDAVAERRLANVTLSWQGALVVTMVNADVSNVTFTADNTGQIVEISFTAEKWEIAHSASGSKVASDSWTQR